MPSSLTFARAEALLTRYKGQGNDFATQLNLACERLIKSGNSRDTKDVVVFQVHLDEDNGAFITLPWHYNTVLACVVLRNGDDNSRRCGYPLQIRDEYFSYLGSGPGFTRNSLYNWGQGFVPETDRFTTFKDWATPKFLRLKFAATEANGGIFNIRGNLNGQPVYTGAGASTIEGENLTTAGATTLTTTSQFSEPPYSISKPQTYGVVSMYTWDGTTETLVARYDPMELSPQWRRYRVPACSGWTEADPGQFLAICKREWVPISNANDPVIPGNIGALRFAIEALLKENSQDFPRAQEWWDKAYDLLAREAEDDTGAGANTPVQVADSFMLGDGGSSYLGGPAYGGNYGY